MARPKTPLGGGGEFLLALKIEETNSGHVTATRPDHPDAIDPLLLRTPSFRCPHSKEGTGRVKADSAKKGRQQALHVQELVC